MLRKLTTKNYNKYCCEIPPIDPYEITLNNIEIDSPTYYFESESIPNKYHLWVPETNIIFPNSEFPKNLQKIPDWLFEYRAFLVFFMNSFAIFNIT